MNPTYKIKLGGDGILRMFYESERWGDTLIAVEGEGALDGIAFVAPSRIFPHNFDVLMTFIKAVKGEIDREQFRSGN